MEHELSMICLSSICPRKNTNGATSSLVRTNPKSDYGTSEDEITASYSTEFLANLLLYKIEEAPIVILGVRGLE